jgi:ATP phosphoribosyltransferase
MIKLALPSGDLRAETAEMLSTLGLHSAEYAAGSRAMRFPLAGDEAEARVFREKDIPIQIALGNYDLGICNRVWLQELLARFPQDEVLALRPLGFGRRDVIAAVSRQTIEELGPFEAWQRVERLRIACEYPNLAEGLARTLRLPRYQLFAVWGAAAAYPPEDAEIAVFARESDRVQHCDLHTVACLASGSAWLLAGRRSLATKNLSPILGPLLRAAPATEAPAPEFAPLLLASGPRRSRLPNRTAGVRLALPDGHAQRHTHAALASAGLRFEGYEEKHAVPRPCSGIDGLSLKVIRPQDMPQQVALGNFDLAITGRDWVLDHLTAFPSSPVREAADLQRSRYSIAAVVDERVPGDTLAAALAYWRSQGRSVIRIASEYAHLADHVARQHHIGRYQIIPVSGASEGFVPEDCEILLEGTETGASVAANRLKVVERLFESTNCLIAGAEPPADANASLYHALIERLRRSVSASV